MKKIASFLTALSILLIVASCNKQTENKETATAPAQKDSVVTTSSVIANVYRGYLGSIKVAELAAQSKRLEIRELGESVIAQDKKLIDSLRAFADAKSITLSDSISKETESNIKKLSQEQSGFDMVLLRVLSSELRQIAASLRSARKVNDEELKAFARRTRAALKDQNDSVRALRKEILKDSDDKQKPA